MKWLRPLLSVASALFATAAVLAGCAQTTNLTTQTPIAPAVVQAASPPGTSAQATATPAGFRFSPGEEVDLRVPDAPQFDYTAKVRPDGQVSFPIIGAVRMEGRSVEEVERELRDRLDQLAGPSASREYLLQPNDEIDVKFPYQSQLNESVKIRPDGKIQLQMVGALQAEGLSPEVLKSELEQRYARHLRKPDLAVIVRSVNSQSVRTADGTGRAGTRGLKPILIVRSFEAPQIFVGGEVARPGTLPYRPGLSLMQAMIEAGGQLPTGNPSELVILRRGPGDSVELLNAAFDVTQLRSPTKDVLLRPFDVVVLPKSGVATLADKLNLYVFNLAPFIRNSSVGVVYNTLSYANK